MSLSIQFQMEFNEWSESAHGVLILIANLGRLCCDEEQLLFILSLFFFRGVASKESELSCGK